MGNVVLTWMAIWYMHPFFSNSSLVLACLTACRAWIMVIRLRYSITVYLIHIETRVFHCLHLLSLCFSLCSHVSTKSFHCLLLFKRSKINQERSKINSNHQSTSPCLAPPYSSAYSQRFQSFPIEIKDQFQERVICDEPSYLCFPWDVSWMSIVQTSVW